MSLKTGSNRGRRHIPQPVDSPINLAELEAPEWLPEDGRDLFHKLSHILADTMHGDDLHLFTSMCAAYGYALWAAKQINEQGITTTDERRIVRKHPAVQVFRDQLAMFNALSSKFGLSPADRAKLVSTQRPQTTDALEELLSDDFED